MRIIGLFLLSILMLSACASDNGQLPTVAGLPASTKTLIPTQSQQLTTPTLPGTIEVADSQANNSNPSNDDDGSAPTDTPIDCNVQDDWELYTVKRGDNLANIANITGSTIDELTQANCMDNPNRIRVGQELYVPNAPDPTGVAPTELVSTTIAPAAIVTVATAPTVTVSEQDATQPPFSVSINKTFESEIDFGLDIPMEWFITESTTPTVENAIITSFEYTLGDEIPQNQWSEDMVSITVTVFQETTTDSLSQWAQSVVTQFQSASNITEVFAPATLFTDSEIEGQSIDYISADDTVVRNYYFIINNHRVQISVGGNFDIAVPVINSLN